MPRVFNNLCNRLKFRLNIYFNKNSTQTNMLVSMMAIFVIAQMTCGGVSVGTGCQHRSSSVVAIVHHGSHSVSSISVVVAISQSRDVSVTISGITVVVTMSRTMVHTMSNGRNSWDGKGLGDGGWDSGHLVGQDGMTLGVTGGVRNGRVDDLRAVLVAHGCRNSSLVMNSGVNGSSADVGQGGENDGELWEDYGLIQTVEGLVLSQNIP